MIVLEEEKADGIREARHGQGQERVEHLVDLERPGERLRDLTQELQLAAVLLGCGASLVLALVELGALERLAALPHEGRVQRLLLGGERSRAVEAQGEKAERAIGGRERDGGKRLAACRLHRLGELRIAIRGYLH